MKFTIMKSDWDGTFNVYPRNVATLNPISTHRFKEDAEAAVELYTEVARLRDLENEDEKETTT
jgi:hypothetical protein